jgi:hypothetical protein
LNQRFGVRLTKELRRRLIRDIQTAKARFLSRSTGRRTVWAVKLETEEGEKEIAVIYDTRCHAIVTFLPEEYMQQRLETRDQVFDEI